MNFLNPAILWGLGALAVPIIVHFFNMQRPKVVLFSNVALVKEVKKNVVRRLRLRQWLILAARLLAITMLVLAFANPVWVSKDNKMLRGNRSVAVVIDNSYSMSAGNEKGAYLQQAATLSQSIVNSYAPQDEFLLMTTGNLRLNHNFGERQEVLEELQKIDFRQKIVTQTELLNSVGKIFDRSSNVVKELYFLSDFQQSSVLADTQQIKMAADSALLIKFIPIASREQQNIYLTAHTIESKIIEKNKPVNMSFTLVNDGEQEAKEIGVKVLLEGKIVAIASQTIPAKSSQSVKLSFTPSNAGWQSGHIELDDYPIEFDNKRYFSLYVPDKEKILVVEGNDRSPGLHILYQDLFTQFSPTFISEKAISTVQLNDYRSIVIAGLSDMSTGLTEKLNLFMKEGGGVMLFPGSNANLSAINGFLQTAGIGKFGELVSNATGSKASKVDLQHPVFEGVFAPTQKNRDFDAPNVFRYYPLELNPSAIQNKILQLENQQPILAEAKIQNGTLFIWSTFPSDSWTDLHLKTVFAPIIYRTTQMMSRALVSNSNQELGKYTAIQVHTKKDDVIKIVGEKGIAYIPEQYLQGDATVLKFDNLDVQPGNYKVMQGEEELDRVSFNISDQESKLAFTDKDALEDKLSKQGLSNITVLKPESYSIKSTIQVEKEGNPLWKYFLIAGILFLATEIFLLRWGEGGKASSN